MNHIPRRNFLRASALAAAGAILLPKETIAQAAKKITASPLKNKKILYVWGGWEGHEPKQSIDVFVPWLESEGATVIVTDTVDSYLDEELMQSLDLIIQVISMGKITADHEKILLKTVRNGCGFAGWHGGIGDSFRENTEYQFMVGGQFVAHPGNITDYRVHITDRNDEITRGLKDFNLLSEQYYMHIDPNVKVLATTVFSGKDAPWVEGAVMPVVWKKYYGKGRIFNSTLGHVMKDFKVHEAFEIQKRGIRWAALSKYAPAEKWLSPAYR